MILPKDHYLSLLFLLRPTEEHLKALAIYLKAFDDGSSVIKNGISFVHNCSSIHHRITLYYLMNELLIMKPTASLASEIRAFVKEHFMEDISLSVKYEILNKRILELEQVWRQKQIIDFEEKYSLEDVVFKIKQSFYDKKKLVAVLKDLARFYEEKLVDKN